MKSRVDRERERERNGEGGKREKERKGMCVCVYERKEKMCEGYSRGISFTLV